jgi:hypothetical protein
MGKQVGPDYITGTVGDRTYYKLNGQYLVRAKSTLSRRRVKRSPAFRRTMEYAGWLAQASKVASEVYRMIVRERRRVETYRAMTGMAMGFIKEGMDKEMVKSQLIQKYVWQIIPVKRQVEKIVVMRPRKVVKIFSIRGNVAGRRRSQGRKADIKSGVG